MLTMPPGSQSPFLANYGFHPCLHPLPAAFPNPAVTDWIQQSHLIVEGAKKAYKRHVDSWQEEALVFTLGQKVGLLANTSRPGHPSQIGQLVPGTLPNMPMY